MEPTDRPLYLPADSKDWPFEPGRLEAPPEGLWLRGKRQLLVPGRRLAIVGSRSPTPYGRDQADRFAAHFAGGGVTIVSGLARGIDSAAHRAALEVGGPTWAVLGSGVDRPWPAGPLTERIGAHGLLLSELALGTPPRRHHFPLRNRLIAGLCRAVLVVEAARASGSLITARWALDQGCQVFVVPGRVDHPLARGCHRLLREGATPVESPEELAADLDWNDLAACRSPGSIPEPDEAEFAALRGETLTAEELAQRTGRDLSSTLVGLVQLELDGWVARGPGGLWRCVSRRTAERGT